MKTEYSPKQYIPLMHINRPQYKDIRTALGLSTRAIESETLDCIKSKFHSGRIPLAVEKIDTSLFGNFRWEEETIYIAQPELLVSYSPETREVIRKPVKDTFSDETPIVVTFDISKVAKAVFAYISYFKESVRIGRDCDGYDPAVFVWDEIYQIKFFHLTNTGLSEVWESPFGTKFQELRNIYPLNNPWSSEELIDSEASTVMNAYQYLVENVKLLHIPTSEPFSEVLSSGDIKPNNKLAEFYPQFTVLRRLVEIAETEPSSQKNADPEIYARLRSFLEGDNLRMAISEYEEISSSADKSNETKMKKQKLLEKYNLENLETLCTKLIEARVDQLILNNVDVVNIGFRSDEGKSAIKSSSSKDEPLRNMIKIYGAYSTQSNHFKKIKSILKMLQSGPKG